jgi:hypothetical protein
MMETWLAAANIALIVAAIPLALALVVLCMRVIALLEAKIINEKRSYVQAAGMEAYAFAESMHPESGKAEKLERAVEYMRRQFEQRHISFDYEQVRAVIERAALELARDG